MALDGLRPQGQVANVPIPDPSELTTDQLRRELGQLRELIEARMDAMDVATNLRLEQMADVPRKIDREIDHLRQLTDERFKSTVGEANERFRAIAGQFTERDVRTTQASGAADDALKAALQAAKELVGAQGEASAAAAVKSETSFTKQIDQIGTIIQTLEKALDARITELKERIDRGEGTRQGGNDQVVVQQTAASASRQVIMVAVGIMGLLLTIVTIAFIAYAAVHK